MADGDTSAVKQQETRKPTGFQLHPENINREGRPRKELVFSDQLLKMVKEKPELLNAIAVTLYELAVKNKDLAAIKEIIDRVEGKAIQRSEISGADGEPIQGLVIIKHGDTTK